MVLDCVVPAIQKDIPNMTVIHGWQSASELCLLPAILITRCFPLIPAFAKNDTPEGFEDRVKEAGGFVIGLAGAFPPQPE
jgi:hypothetical protein